jgi:hypothetical protein
MLLLQYSGEQRGIEAFPKMHDTVLKILRAVPNMLFCTSTATRGPLTHVLNLDCATMDHWCPGQRASCMQTCGTEA